MSYGTDVVRFSNMNQENRTDPMVEVFPRMTKCTFHKVRNTNLTTLKRRYKFFCIVWSVWFHTTSRRPLSVGLKHPERKNLHFPVVLVYYHSDSVRFGYRLFRSRYPTTQYQRNDPKEKIPLRV